MTGAELGERIVAKGFAPSRYILDINGSLAVPHTMTLPAPWNLPSRLFRSPIEVQHGRTGACRIGLMHPLLIDHPYVQIVEEALGEAIDPDGVRNDYGVSNARTARWWHAVDLVTAGLWRELIETRAFTTDQDIVGTVSYGLAYSQHDAAQRHGYISTGEARVMLAAIDSDEPLNPSAVLAAFSAPSACRQDSGKEHWPINGPTGVDAATGAWGRVFGIEAGWFSHDRAGFLAWTQHGRDRYAAGNADTFTESRTGQEAFAF